MKKKLFIVVIVILIIIVGYNIFNKFLSKKISEGDIIEFKYEYGGYDNGMWNYHIYTKDDKVYILAKGLNGVDLRLDKEIDRQVLEDLAEIVRENEIYEWNQFVGTNPFIYDGYSFSLTINYSNGKKVEAHGHENYPSNYDEAHEILSEYLESIN